MDSYTAEVYYNSIATNNTSPALIPMIPFKQISLSLLNAGGSLYNIIIRNREGAWAAQMAAIATEFGLHSQ